MKLLTLLICVGFALPATAQETVVVTMKDFVFEPEEVTIQVGDTVRWENHERRQFHNIWFQEQGEDPGPYLFPEESMERTFDQPGTYPYLCQPHEGRNMHGVVIVVK